MDTQSENPVEKKSAWLLGVCGMGVGPLAIYMRGEGWDVSGWDDAADSPMLAFLEKSGVRLSPVPPAGVSVIGRSSAVKPGNPLHDAALASGAKILRRGELLASRMAEKKLIAVCGSHGKTTTSGMLARALDAAGTPAGYVLGGLYRDASFPPARFSSASDWVVAEVDESDGTISGFSPEITAAVNLDWDHPDYYRSEADLEKTFRALFLRTRCAVFVPENSERLRRISSGINVPVFTVGESGDFSFRVLETNGATTRISLGGKFPSGTIELPVAGKFNVMNAALALAVAVFVGGKIAREPLGNFSGMRRRQDVLFRSDALEVVADYAHHPTEISALLRVLRERAPRRLVVVFQPHRHSRTRQYASAFARALSIADETLLMPVYSAGEACVPGGESVDILANLPTETATAFSFFPELPPLFARLREIASDAASRAGVTTIAFVGAGDIDRKAASVFARELRFREIASSRARGGNFFSEMKTLFPHENALEEEKCIGKITTLGVGGNARYFAEPTNLVALETLLRGAAIYEIPVEIVGRGSNLLVPDDGFRGLVIRLSGVVWRGIRRVSVENEKSDGSVFLRVGAGATLHELCAFAAREGFGGFEFLDGIPGTLGGALRMNAGAAGGEIFDVVESVELISADGERREVRREELSPVCRDCPDLRGAIALSAILRVPIRRAPEEIRARMAACSEARWASQPRGRSAGCTFKNPAGASAGKIIDELGLKGTRVGGAEISSVHANFIVVREGASAADVIALVRKIRAAVKASRGIELSPEIVLLGASWENIF